MQRQTRLQGETTGKPRLTGKDWNGNRDLQWEAGGMQPGGTKVTSSFSKVLVC